MVGWISTGMPRPLSSTVTMLSSEMVDGDAVAEAGHGLVDAVIDDLINQVVQAALVGRADVHAGALAHGLQPFQHLDIGGGILGSFFSVALDSS